MSNASCSSLVSPVPAGTAAVASSASLRPSSSATFASPPLMFSTTLNACQCPGGLPFLRFGGVVGVRRAYRFAQFVKAHARSPPGIIVTVHVPGYFLVLVVGFVILVTGRFFRFGYCFRNVFFRLSVSLRRKNSIIFSRLLEVSRFVLRCPDLSALVSAFTYQRVARNPVSWEWRIIRSAR